MIEVTQTALDAVASPPLVPGDRPIDLVHLSRMTLGDRALERDVLVLFERQIAHGIAREDELGFRLVGQALKHGEG